LFKGGEITYIPNESWQWIPKDLIVCFLW